MWQSAKLSVWAITEPDVNDEQTSVRQLRSLVQQFVDERNWRQFHSPKNLSMSLAIEAGELMEHFQWIDSESSRKLADDPTAVTAAGEELADVLCYALALANVLGLDVAECIERKMVKNAQKYPAEKFWGIARAEPK
jgi:dCTP diphosphatase